MNGVWTRWVCAWGVAFGLAIMPAVRAEEAPQKGAATMSADTRQKLMESLARGAQYLRQNQQADGTWEKNPGITGLAVTSVLRQTGVDHARSLPEVTKALDYLKGLAKPDGGVYEKDLPHYMTAVSMMALIEGGRAGDKAVIEKGREYLTTNLLDESEGVNPSDIWYGGMGYGSAPRPNRRADLISTEYALRALKEASLPGDNAAWDKAIKFLQRTQNNSETNDQKWAANDGGFVYYPGFSYHTEGGTKSYGSVTYAGLLSYTYANLKKQDPRVQAALKWIRENYTVDENPGMGQKTVYYYYMVFAKALQAVDEPVIVDARGQRHNWREELGRKILTLQHPEGYWVNEVKDEWQDNKVLVTAFTMATIEYTLKP
jgi:squalene-hopene/tetraprenyl-beta-curcumene cyclase